MNKKLVISLLGILFLSLEVSLTAGCANKDEMKMPDNEINAALEAGKTFHSDKPLKFSILYLDNPAYPMKNDWLLWSEITKRTNVSLKIVSVPYDEYNEKRSLLISTGDAPYIITKTYPGSEEAYISSGAILPVSDYVKFMPSYEKKIKAWNLKNELKTITQADGKYYVLPGVHEKARYDYSLLIRKDIFNKEGLRVPVTWDEVYEAAKTLKAKYPDIYPISDRWKTDALTNFMAPTFGVMAGWGAGNGIKYDSSKDSFFFYPTTNEYKDFITYFNKMVEEGLMDPESFTQSDDEAKQKFESGKAFMITSNIQETLALQQSMEKSLGKDKFQLSHMRNPQGPKGDVAYSSRLENGIIIPSNAKGNPNFISMIEFIDWLWYSDEGQELTKWGAQGITYTKADDGTRAFVHGINFNNLSKIPTPADKDLRKDFGFSNGVFSYGGAEILKTSMMNDLEKTFQKEMADKRTLSPVPPILYDEAEREAANMKGILLMDYVKVQTIKFMTGNDPLSNWNQFVVQCKAKGSEDLVKQVNEVYNRTKHRLK